MNSEILVATNGYTRTWSGIEYAAWLGKTLRVPLTLIGIIEQKQRPNIDEEIHPLDDIFGQAVALFKEQKLKYRLEIQEGHAEDVIPKKAKEKDFLTVLTPLGRPPLRRLLLRRSFHQLMADIEGPILYVPSACIPPTHMLVCLGGLGYGITAEDLGLEIARVVKSPATLLHVVPPIEKDYPEARTVRENWDHLTDTDTLLGRTLRNALDKASEKNVQANLKLRQGNVIEEILAELREGDYDFVCMGSLYSAHGLRQLYAPNVTAEVAEVIGCPVLTVRHQLQEE
ncbi:MAG: universal stress protein [Anaerolineales bacterium]|jgi:nucleotide-binding universal stress UspA family protein